MNIYPTASIAAVPGAAEAAAAARPATGAAGRPDTAAATSSAAPATAAPARAATTPVTPATPVDAHDLKNSVDAINRFLKVDDQVQFSIDADSGYSVVKVIDIESRKVLRQFPSQQALDIGKDLSGLKGILVDSKA